MLVTGIKASGDPHLGNLVGMIRPTVAMAARHESYVFVADLHALTTVGDADALRAHTHDVTAGLLAAGLDPLRSVLFRQSDIPEIPELAWTLACLTPIGLLQRAHAFKAATSEGRSATVGLFAYPILMAADILALRGELVPVGPDQQQHVEIARDLARRFNGQYAPLFGLPEAHHGPGASVSLPGLDGRKMSKHYRNTIPLSSGARERRALVRRIVTDSSGASESRELASAPVADLFRAFASEVEAEGFELRLRQGSIGWREAKDELADLLDREVGPIQRRFAELRADPDHLEQVLETGADRARIRARETLEDVRALIGTGAPGRQASAPVGTDALDEALEMTFPASDPTAVSPSRVRRGRPGARSRRA